jgi:hypothetical protein
MGNISLCQTHKSHLVMHVCVFQDSCALGNLLVVCQSKLFHSNGGVVWDLGSSAFVFFTWVLEKTFCVEGRPLVSHIENNLKWPMVLMREIKVIWPQETCSFWLDYLVVDSIGYSNFFNWPYLLNGCFKNIVLRSFLGNFWYKIPLKAMLNVW